MKRRKLLQVIAASLGGATLANACGEGSPVEPNPPPFANGYRFFVVKSIGGAVPGGATVRQFRYDCTIDAEGEVIYGIVDSNGRSALYGLALSFAGVPTILSERLVVREGDTLPDGRPIQELHNYDVNPHGTCVIVLRVGTGIILAGGDEFGHDVVCRGSKTTPVAPLLYEGLTTPEGHVFVGRFGDVDTHTGHDTLVVARYIHWHEADSHIPDNDAHDTRGMEGLFLLPGGVAGQARLVTNLEDVVSGGDLVGGFGLIDLHDDGNYIAQLHPSRLQDTTPGLMAGFTMGDQGARLYRGNVGQRRARAATTLSGSSTSALLGQQTGASVFGPRLGPGNRAAFVLHTSDTSMALHYDGLRLVETGERSAAGSLVTGMMPPAFGPDGELFYALITTSGHELYVTGGDQHARLLGSGDRLANDPREVDMIVLGHSTEHVDDEGRIALITTFTDGSSALVIGLPV